MYPVNANWKVYVDNFLEGYHIPLVHPGLNREIDYRSYGTELRTRHVVQSAFGGRRIVIFSGGPAKDRKAIIDEIRGLADGGAFGSIMGRNSFQRPKTEAIELLHEVMDIYQSV